jgi:hypothetical protein
VGDDDVLTSAFDFSGYAAAVEGKDVTAWAAFHALVA